MMSSKERVVTAGVKYFPSQLIRTEGCRLCACLCACERDVYFLTEMQHCNLPVTVASDQCSAAPPVQSQTGVRGLVFQRKANRPLCGPILFLQRCASFSDVPSEVLFFDIVLFLSLFFPAHVKWLKAKVRVTVHLTPPPYSCSVGSLL